MKRKTPSTSVDPLPVLNPKAAGLDIGSEEIWAAVPPDCDVSLVRDVLRIPGQVRLMPPDKSSASPCRAVIPSRRGFRRPSPTCLGKMICSLIWAKIGS